MAERATPAGQTPAAQSPAAQTPRSQDPSGPHRAEPDRPRRIIALDLARFLAIVGMMAAHLLFRDPPAVVTVVVTGFPSTLFAVLGGVSAVVSTRSYRAQGRPRAARWSVAVRGLTVAAIGVFLFLSPSFVVVVLVSYGISLLLTSLVMQLRLTALLPILGILVLAGPQAVWWGSTAAGAGSGAVGVLARVVSIAFLSGPYPVITWLTFMLIGVCVGRLIVDSPAPGRAGWRLVIGGSSMFAVATAADLLSRGLVVHGLVASGTTRVVAERLAGSIESHSGVPIGPGWIAVVSAVPHSGTTADILRTAGVAVLIIGALLLAGTPADGRRLPVLVRIVVRAGTAPLTIYTLHVVVVGVAAALAGPDVRTAPPWWVAGPAALAMHVAGALVIGAILDLLDKRGPLETVVSAIARRGARLAGRR